MPRKMTAYEVIAAARKAAKPQTNGTSSQSPSGRYKSSVTVAATPETSVASSNASPELEVRREGRTEPLRNEPNVGQSDTMPKTKNPPNQISPNSLGATIQASTPGMTGRKATVKSRIGQALHPVRAFPASTTNVKSLITSSRATSLLPSTRVSSDHSYNVKTVRVEQTTCYELVARPRECKVLNHPPEIEHESVASSNVLIDQTDRIPLQTTSENALPAQSSEKMVEEKALYSRVSQQPEEQKFSSKLESSSQDYKRLNATSERNEETPKQTKGPEWDNTEHRSAFERIPPSQQMVSSPPLQSKSLHNSKISKPISRHSHDLRKASGKDPVGPDRKYFSKPIPPVFDASSPDALAAMSAAYASDIMQMQSQLELFSPAASYMPRSTKPLGMPPKKFRNDTLDASSPEAMAAMTAAFTYNQGQRDHNAEKPPYLSPRGNNEFSRYPEKPKHPHTGSHKGNTLSYKRLHHREVDLGSLHGHKFSAFLVCTICEILYFWYVRKPSTHLRLVNLVLAISLYSGVFDTHVQRAPLGMMLNRLAAWILALLALSSSVYTSPAGASWQLGEMRLLHMVGTFLFPLVLLDSINVLRAEIRCRNFILKGFVVESLYMYSFLLGVPIARLLLNDDVIALLSQPYQVAETIYIVAIFSALVVAIEYFFVCQVAAGNVSKEFWQGVTSFLWGFFHAPGCALLVWKLNGITAGAYIYVGSFFIFLVGRVCEPILEEVGLLLYKETSILPSPKKLS